MSLTRFEWLIAKLIPKFYLFLCWILEDNDKTRLEEWKKNNIERLKGHPK